MLLEGCKRFLQYVMNEDYFVFASNFDVLSCNQNYQQVMLSKSEAEI